MSLLLPTVAIETRHHELEAERLKLDEEELKVRQERLNLERDEITFRRRVLDYQCEQYFGKASMNTLSDACNVLPRLTASTTVPQENKLQLENKADSLTERRVQVWWCGDKRFYKGKIVKTGVFIKYDDGQAQWESNYESDDESEETVDSQCQRTPGCPKPTGHVGRCPGASRFSSGLNKRTCCQTLETNHSKRPRSEPRRLGHNDYWGLGVARQWCEETY